MIPMRQTGAMAREMPSGEAALYAPGGDQLIMLNSIGSIVWGLCDGERNVDEITTLITQRFPDVNATRVRDDIAHLVTELQKLGLLET